MNIRLIAFFLYLTNTFILHSETGNDLKLDPEKFLEKTVSLRGVISTSYYDSRPTLAADDSGKFFLMETFKSKRVSSGNQTSNAFDSDGYVKVYVPNEKVTSFVSSFKTDTPKGFSGVFKKYTPKAQNSGSDKLEKRDESFYYVDLTPKNPKW